MADNSTASGVVAVNPGARTMAILYDEEYEQVIKFGANYKKRLVRLALAKEILRTKLPTLSRLVRKGTMSKDTAIPKRRSYKRGFKNQNL